MTAWMDKRNKHWLSGDRDDPRRRKPKPPAGPPPPEPSDKALPNVIEIPVRCPRCQSKHTRVTHTELPVRYRKCSECGQNFKSTEEPEKDWA